LQKRFIGILLLLILTVPATITYSWLQYRKTTVRKEIKHKIISGIDKEELVLLKFSKQEAKTKLEWEHSKEFEYDEEMYDVVETQSIGDSVYYWCWWDHKETRLNKQLGELVAKVLGSDEKSTEQQHRLISFTLKPFYISKLLDIETPWHTVIDKQFRPVSESLNLIFYSPPKPPPRVVNIS